MESFHINLASSPVSPAFLVYSIYFASTFPHSDLSLPPLNVNTFKALLYTSQSTVLRFSSSCAQLFVIQPTLDTKSAMPNSMALTPYGSNGSTDLTMAVLGCGKYSEDEHTALHGAPLSVGGYKRRACC